MTMLARTLRGGQGIVSIEALLAGLTLDLALRPVAGLPYTIYGLLWHIDFGQRQLLSALGREQTSWPPVAEQWPQSAPPQAEFGELLASLWTGVQRAVQAADDPALAPRSGTLSAEAGRDLETLTDLAAHNAYHWGQVVLMRRVLGDWPPAAN